MPSICREPRIVFPNRKKKRNGDEIIQKRFVISENTYHFGPLHCGKTRDRSATYNETVPQLEYLIMPPY